jgi:hypothetical protein
LRADGLDEAIERATADTVERHGEVFSAGNRDHPDPGVLTTDRLKHRQFVQTGKTGAEQHDVRVFAADDHHCLGSGAGMSDSIAFGGERAGEELPIRVVVIDDKNAGEHPAIQSAEPSGGTSGTGSGRVAFRVSMGTASLTGTPRPKASRIRIPTSLPSI